VSDLDYTKDTKSPLQIVAGFLNQIEKEDTIGGLKIPKIKGINDGLFKINSKKDIIVLKKNKIDSLLEKYFVNQCKNLGFDINFITFSHLSDFIKILCKEFIACNKNVHENSIKNKKLKNIYMSLINTTLFTIKPFTNSIEVQKEAFQIHQRFNYNLGFSSYFNFIINY
jgi:hypothetical protein